MEALLSIRENKSLIIIRKPDKRNGVVLMIKTDYVQKINFVGFIKTCIGQKRQKRQKSGKASKLLESMKKKKNT